MKSVLGIALLALAVPIFALAQSHRNADEPIQLLLGNYTVSEDGKPVIEISGRCGGQVLAFHLPKQGWFVTSVSPVAGYDFRKAGRLKGKKLSFTYDDRRYEIVSDASISSRNKELDVWVLRIPPPFNAEELTGGKVVNCSSSFEYFLETNGLKRKAE